MRLIRKLHNQRGVSLLVSLVFFLVCAMVAAVILGSATTNAEKLQHQQEEQQVYYSVSSAAQLVRDTIEQLSMTGSESYTHHTCLDMPPIQNALGEVTYEPEREQDVSAYEGMTISKSGNVQDDPDQLLSLLREGVEQVYKSTLTYAADEKKPFNGWTGQFTVNDKKCAVDVSVTINEAYDLTVQFVPQEEKWQKDYGMTLICNGKSSRADESVETRTQVTDHTYTYDDKINGDKQTGTISCDEIVRRYSTTISWEPGMIYKGANGNG